ncbi:nuclear transport factor 2 family protein [Alteromonas sp. ALT199]|uniref:nuclear transport factor 2 family protein n=1 Tax=unclassified Alteromonas TaxID=2614992 RepID=UPI0004498D6A|nr:nuclear transport factor 2 family protein [Alteromonas sp. ALT199]MBT3133800.1 nuclear transport factor 2 family protein [Alteromonas sp. ALT199]
MKYLLLGLLMLTIAANVSANTNRDLVNQTLDALHHNASVADFDAYFNLYHDSAVFIGTDASEVWTKEAFKAYAKPHFDKGKGWTYHPRDRHIYFSPDNNVAWFDELLDNKGLGETRGTGVLIKTGSDWKLTQYHLTIPIPNALAGAVADQVRAMQ